MANKGKWGCGPTDQVRHFYIPFDGFWSRLCDYPHSRIDTITKSEKVPKCPTCIEAVRDRT